MYVMILIQIWEKIFSFYVSSFYFLLFFFVIFAFAWCWLMMLINFASVCGSLIMVFFMVYGTCISTSRRKRERKNKWLNMWPYFYGKCNLIYFIYHFLLLNVLCSTNNTNGVSVMYVYVWGSNGLRKKKPNVN